MSCLLHFLSTNTLFLDVFSRTERIQKMPLGNDIFQKAFLHLQPEPCCIPGYFLYARGITFIIAYYQRLCKAAQLMSPLSQGHLVQLSNIELYSFFFVFLLSFDEIKHKDFANPVDIRERVLLPCRATIIPGNPGDTCSGGTYAGKKKSKRE